MVNAAFVEFVQSLFPAADPEKARDCIKTLTKDPPHAKELYSLILPDPIYQGDILEPVDFMVHDSGEYVVRSSAGMLLSHSCDMRNDDEVILAECYPAADFRDDAQLLASIKSNKIYHLMYLKAMPRNRELVVNLTRVQTLSTASLNERLGAGDLARVSSFTDLGYYFFLAKLTVHLFRPREADEVRGGPPPLTLLERGGAAFRILRRRGS